MRVLYLECPCGRQAKVAWPMDRTTMRSEILPLTKCSRCRQPATDMRIIWETCANALEGAEVLRVKL